MHLLQEGPACTRPHRASYPGAEEGIAPSRQLTPIDTRMGRRGVATFGHLRHPSSSHPPLNSRPKSISQRADDNGWKIQFERGGEFTCFADISNKLSSLLLIVLGYLRLNLMQLHIREGAEHSGAHSETHSMIHIETQRETHSVRHSVKYRTDSETDRERN